MFRLTTLTIEKKRRRKNMMQAWYAKQYALAEIVFRPSGVISSKKVGGQEYSKSG